MPALFEEFKTIYKHNPTYRDRAFFDWQYKDTPFSANTDEYSLWLLRSDGQIKGFLGYVPVEFRHEGEIKRACWLQTWYAYGTGGYGLRLLNKVMSEFDNRLMIGFSDKAEAVFKMFQIPYTAAMPRFDAVLDVTRAAELFKITDAAALDSLNDKSKLLAKLGSPNGISSAQRFDESEEFGFDHWPAIKGFVRRTGRYLNWRYVDIPLHEYKIIRGRAGEFAIYRIEPIMHHKECAIRLVEWCFRDDMAANALSYLVEEGRKNDAVVIDFFSSSKEPAKKLLEHGFFGDRDLIAKIPYLFRPTYFSGEEIRIGFDLPPHRQARPLDLESWYVTKGDSELDRFKL